MAKKEIADIIVLSSSPCCFTSAARTGDGLSVSNWASAYETNNQNSGESYNENIKSSFCAVTDQFNSHYVGYTTLQSIKTSNRGSYMTNLRLINLFPIPFDHL